MKRINLFLSCVVLLSLTGCDDNYQPMPKSTLPVLFHIQTCNVYHWVWQNDINDEYEDCLDDPPVSASQCATDKDEMRAIARDAWEDCLIQLPYVLYECVEQLQPFSKTHDSDGDGISDNHEYEGGTNPCEPCSFGGTPGVDCDGDLNHDRDIRNNADDTHPLCGQMYDGEWIPNPEAINGNPCA